MLNADSSFLLLEEGRKTEAIEISTHVGGGAVNAAVAMARLGLDVAALVKLGKDQRAETVLAHLLQEGVSTRWAMRDGRAPTRRLGAGLLARPQRRHLHVPRCQHAAGGGRPARGGVRRRCRLRVLAEQRVRRRLSSHRRPRQGAEVRWSPTNPRVRQLSSRGPAFQEACADIDILAINRSEADVLVPALVARFGEGGPRSATRAGESHRGLLARGFAGGGHEMTLARLFRRASRAGAALRDRDRRPAWRVPRDAGCHPLLPGAGDQGCRHRGRRRCLQCHVHRLYRARPGQPQEALRAAPSTLLRSSATSIRRPACCRRRRSTKSWLRCATSCPCALGRTSARRPNKFLNSNQAKYWDARCSIKAGADSRANIRPPGQGPVYRHRRHAPRHGADARCGDCAVRNS